MSHGVRAQENRTITVSIPKSLVKDIDQFAKADDRSRSKWIVRELQQAVEFYRSRRAIQIAENVAGKHEVDLHRKNRPHPKILSGSAGMAICLCLQTGGFLAHGLAFAAPII